MLDGVGWRDLALGLIVASRPLSCWGSWFACTTRELDASDRPVGHLPELSGRGGVAGAVRTDPAALVWLGVSMLLAAWRGYAGCESLAISNWLLRRDDQVSCVVFWPLDEVETRMAGNTTARLGAVSCAPVRADSGWKSLQGGVDHLCSIGSPVAGV